MNGEPKDTELFTTYCRYAFHSQPKKKSSVTLTARMLLTYRRLSGFVPHRLRRLERREAK